MKIQVRMTGIGKPLERELILRNKDHFKAQQTNIAAVISSKKSKNRIPRKQKYKTNLTKQYR